MNIFRSWSSCVIVGLNQQTDKRRNILSPRFPSWFSISFSAYLWFPRIHTRALFIIDIEIWFEKRAVRVWCSDFYMQSLFLPNWDWSGVFAYFNKSHLNRILQIICRMLAHWMGGGERAKSGAQTTEVETLAMIMATPWYLHHNNNVQIWLLNAWNIFVASTVDLFFH